MWEVIGYALIALGSIVGSLITNKGNKENSEDQRDWEEAMQDKENEFNLPVNDVQRQMDAGINPLSVAMAAGGSSYAATRSAGHNPVDIPALIDPMSAFGQNASQIGSAFDRFQSGLSDKTFRSARLEQINEQNNQLRASVKQLNASSEAQIIANKYADQRELWALAGKKADVFLTYANEASVRAITKRTYQEIENLVKENIKTDTEIDLNYLKMDEVLAYIDNIKQDTALKGSQINVNDAQASEIAQREQLEAAETDLKSQESDRYSEVTDKVIAQYDAAIEKIMAETGKTKEEAYWIWFDKVESQSLNFFGSKISQTRFGRRKLRKVADKMIQERAR